MKKVFAILFVMAIVMGFAFAEDPAPVTRTETHKIGIRAEIGEVLPAFQLYLSDARKTNSGSTRFVNGGDYSVAAPEEGNSDIDFTSARVTARTVTVVAKLTNAAKTTKSFTLSFSDGVFTVNKGSGTATISPVITVTSKVAAVTDGVNVVSATNTPAADGNPAVNTATVPFNGTTCTTKDLCSVTYVYAQDTAINPGSYTANITMTVTSTF